MPASAAYLDTSAFVKLVVAEPESDALRQSLGRWPERVSSDLLRVEAVRALRRSANERFVPQARRMFGALRLVRLDAALLDRAGELGSSELGSLDAIHLAAALELTSDLGVVFTYDERLAGAARQAGLIVEAPA